MNYFALPLVIILIVGYIIYLSNKSTKEKTDIKNDMVTLDDIKNSLDDVVSENALTRLLVLVQAIDKKHINDDRYIIKVDSTKGAIEARRKEITEKYVESDLNDTTNN